MNEKLKGKKNQTTKDESISTVENHKDKNEGVWGAILHFYKIVSNYYYVKKQNKYSNCRFQQLLILWPTGLSAITQSDFFPRSCISCNK